MFQLKAASGKYVFLRPPGGAGEPEAHGGCLSQPYSINGNYVVHLRLAGDEGKRKLPLSTCEALDHDDDLKSGWDGEENKACSPVSVQSLTSIKHSSPESLIYLNQFILNILSF